MAVIRASNKLSSNQSEYAISSRSYVFFRVITDQNGTRLMTATAAEDSGSDRVYEDQKALITATVRTLEKYEFQWASKVDHVGRAYIETSVYPDYDDIVHIANVALEDMGFDDISIQAIQDIRRIYEEFSIDESGEDTYLSDGMWVTSDGRIVQR